MPPGKRRILSGAYWVTWVRTNAPVSDKIERLDGSFGNKVREFKEALESAEPKGSVKVKVTHTYRSPQAAYLWHWAWKISERRCAPKDALPYKDSAPIPDIQWDHGNLAASIKGATDMVNGFGLSTPRSRYPSHVPPSLDTLHKKGLAVDMTIEFSKEIQVKKKDGTVVPIKPGPVNANSKLHDVGASYGVKKHKTDGPHWSTDGR